MILVTLISTVFSVSVFVVGAFMGSGGSRREREALNGMCGDGEKGGETMEKAISQQHPLYGHGVCKWPGCESVCEDFPSFLK
jgi:hypothetical protein